MPVFERTAPDGPDELPRQPFPDLLRQPSPRARTLVHEHAADECTVAQETIRAAAG
jgi:hypothetical protein